MRTLLLSDIHLGNDGDYDIFSGSEALPALLSRFESEPTRVILNGDTTDFLMNQDPLELDTQRAVGQARAIAEASSTTPTWRALGRLLANDGELIVRLGNHDIELALAEVQEVFKSALDQPAEVTARVVFERGEAPRLLDVGGARILVTHGEQNDRMNMVSHDLLPGPGAPPTADAKKFRYPPGSRFVKEILNPLKKDEGMRFVDLLKPDFEGAALAALAVNPSATRVVFQRSTFDIVTEVLGKLGQVSFPAGAEPGELGLADSLQDADLTMDEASALRSALMSDAAASFGLTDFLTSAAEKVGKAGLRLYARAHRVLAGRSSDTFFELETPDEEFNEAKRLATKFGAKAVITGHSHAARWRDEETLYLNTGTWIWLMGLPAADASEEEWSALLDGLKSDPGLAGADGQRRLVTRYTPVTIEEDAAGGARISLHNFEGDGLHTVMEKTVS